MPLNECVRRLKAVGFALEELEVKGSRNLDILLGSIQELNRIATAIEKGIKEMDSSMPEIKIQVEPDNTSEEPG